MCCWRRPEFAAQQYTAKQTLEYTQSLYEKKLVTYPRTDSRYLSDDMAQTAENVIKKVLSTELFQKKPVFSTDVKRLLDSKKVTDHHAIIPTVTVSDEEIEKLPEAGIFVK